jgi:hypothetical protein
VGYYPGFEGRGNLTRQDSPVGDVLVAVGPAAPGSVTVLNPARRASFWRGEPVGLLVQVRGPGDRVEARLTVRHLGTQAAVASLAVPAALRDGFGVGEAALASGTLAPGEYEVVPEVEGLLAYPYPFTVAGPPVSGMPVVNSPLFAPVEPAAYERLGVSGWVDVMPSTGGFAPPWPSAAAAGRGPAAAEPSLPLAGRPDPGVYDRLARANWLLLQGVQSWQISFGLHHSVPEHVDETLRKHLVYAQLGRRFPSTLGLVFDYDLAGTGPGLGYAEPYVKAGRRRMALLARRWEQAWEEARRHGAAEADRGRLLGLFHAGVIADVYRRSVAGLHAAVPEQRHTSAVTADHNDLHNGQYLPAVYGPLDFRYLEVWNDQIYPNGAHDMQESFWASLLRMEKPEGQPVWVTVPTAPQPGTHLRRSLEAVARGASAVGYNGEGGAGLAGGWGRAGPLGRPHRPGVADRRRGPPVRRLAQPLRAGRVGGDPLFRLAGRQQLRRPEPRLLRLLHAGPAQPAGPAADRGRGCRRGPALGQGPPARRADRPAAGGDAQGHRGLRRRGRPGVV